MMDALLSHRVAFLCDRRRRLTIAISLYVFQRRPFDRSIGLGDPELLSEGAPEGEAP